jgi:uncharacterized membrane protein
MRRLIVPAASLAASLAAIALSACGGGGKDSDGKPSPPDMAANFAQPLDARGSDPAWGLTVRGTTLTLSQPNQPVLVGVAPGAVIQPHAASWSAALPDGRTLKATLYASSCTEPATGATYPFSAEVQLPGAAPLDGCGGPPAAARAPRAVSPGRGTAK